MRQLEFNLTAKVLAFPPSRRRSFVRKVAETIMQNNDDDAERYWQAVVDGIAWPMLNAGVPRPIVEDQVRKFHDAVQQQIYLVEDRAGGAG
ncbi:hypothetical protein EET67_20605 [Pseudaminobacter arsenicus]|uniref:Uncharacterized protein n=1 Tax=Borborobacter arsenicus TaxID=1851146 RepID=A0A432V133_9HYPH|nr:DUF6074 family protein [Pseudaminobacter arsenicus]RUM95924.1 hypothetical protein EET67_20605 [Pseudaminobacter arsenicus]